MSGLGHICAWLAASALALGVCGGCIYDGLVAEDGSGFSRGPSRWGMLYGGTRLPVRGSGYWIPPKWSVRGLNYGVDELVSTVVYAGRVLHAEDSRLVVGVGDMSRVHGGRSPWHRSHQTGRDVDFLFLVKDRRGNPVHCDQMRKYDRSGAERVAPDARSELFFDVRANWSLVAALLNNPVSEVQYIFIQDDLRHLLLDYAVAHGVSVALVRRAAETLLQPSDSAPHDDHMHVRIYCPDDDISAGCIDFGQMRWHKKDLKYGGRIQRLRRYDSLAIYIPVGNLAWLMR